MTDRPIIFSPPALRALLDGRKTQDRRLAWQKPRLALKVGDGPIEPVLVPTVWQRVEPGDRLWVRESWRIGGWEDCGMVWLRYPADNAGSPWLQPDDSDALIERVCDELDRAGVPLNAEGNYTSTEKLRTRSAVAMPRWASRITLTVTEVRRQRVQEISAEDALAEGIEPDRSAFLHAGWWVYDGPRLENGEPANITTDPVHSFASLWRSLHGRDAWESNPEVVALTFAVEQRNIDAAPKVEIANR